MTGEPPHHAGEPPRQGLLDTNVLVLRRWIDPTELPDEMAISAVTLAELSAGPHQVRPDSEQDMYDEHEERARRTETLQRAESEFDPVPFDAEAARIYGRVTAAVVAAGREPRRRIADRMIAATAISEDLPSTPRTQATMQSWRSLFASFQSRARRCRTRSGLTAASSRGVPSAGPTVRRTTVIALSLPMVATSRA